MNKTQKKTDLNMKATATLTGRKPN